jgi:hypothetical protein
MELKSLTDREEEVIRRQLQIQGRNHKSITLSALLRLESQCRRTLDDPALTPEKRIFAEENLTRIMRRISEF